MLQASFHIADDAVSFFLVVIVLHVLHGRTGKHPFRSLHRTVSCTDVYCADRARRSAQELKNPYRFTTLVCAQRVIDRRESGMRRIGSVVRYRKGAAGIEI